MPRPIVRWALAAPMLAVASCQMSGGRDVAQRDAAEHMQEHFELVDAVKQAIIDGDLGTARTVAEEFASHREPETVRGPATIAREMRATASDIADATDLEAAAVAIGRLGIVCGQCHGVTDARPGFPIDVSELASTDAPSPPLDAVAHMQRHQWAADRMWEALIVPSDVYWMWGATTLEGAALHREDLAEQPSDVNVTRLAARVHEIGLEAARTEDSERRGDLYGQLLATCAACHAELRR